MSDPSNNQKIDQEWIRVIESPSSDSIRRQDIQPRLNEWIESVSPVTILEIGAGQGICSSYIDLNNRLYTGVEPSLQLVERARHLYKRNFVVGTAEVLPFDDNSFDCAFSIAVWHLLPHLATAVSELNRVLKPHGSFFIVSANPDAYQLWTAPYKNIQLNGKQFKGDIAVHDGSFAKETLYLHSSHEITDSFSTATLKINKIDAFRKVGDYQQFIQIEGQKIS